MGGGHGRERVERRLRAILAADVAGYSRLMGADEEGTLAALKTLRREVADPKIKEHRRRIVNTTGDGLLSEFRGARLSADRHALGKRASPCSCSAVSPPLEQRPISRKISPSVGVNIPFATSGALQPTPKWLRRGQMAKRLAGIHI